ncbi:hypothetical protein GCM10007363_17690 [Pseudomonas fluvialis]|uniref:Uncharacterized protein n=1 Tax=Pseudomonas fluvialis TaxID=1793966 RepID=A0ABQ2ALK6_9PSED|nr:hypothetical protein GCM10007363_17690 [Pseudomonas fluvialis]
MLNGIFWILCSGAKWRDLPERYGPWKTVYQRFRQWRDNGTFEQVLRHLHLRLREDGLIDLDTWMVDSTSIRATRAASGAGKRGARENRSTTVSGAAEADYHLFGFTGTPIFAKNSATGGNPLRRTTEQAFGDKLHTYTIVDAINDKNVLPFRIDYINTLKMQARIKDKQVSAIDTERALLAPERISQIVGYIREHFDQKTKRASTYRHDGKRVAGFNSLFACASIDAAKRYYAEFSAQQQALPEAQQLKVGLIYSFAANEDDEDGLLGEEEFEAEGLDQSSRDFLDAAIKDYNALFATSFDTSADKFQNYYKDLSQRLKKRELDLVIVVNMFLTGFDATTLNTLWVDKNLKAHGLIQAYSRTNRILNSVKTYGNIVSFRNLEQETNDALALFGNKDANTAMSIGGNRTIRSTNSNSARHPARMPANMAAAARIRNSFIVCLPHR